MDEIIITGYHEVIAFHVALKNGRTFDFCGRYVKRLVDNHLLITLNEAFIAAFDISEISIAVTMKMFFSADNCQIYESIENLIRDSKVGDDESKH